MPSPLMVPLGLTESEQADVVAFLGALSGSPPPAEWLCNGSVNLDVTGVDGGITPRCPLASP